MQRDFSKLCNSKRKLAPLRANKEPELKKAADFSFSHKQGDQSKIMTPKTMKRLPISRTDHKQVFALERSPRLQEKSDSKESQRRIEVNQKRFPIDFF